jgi:ATP adenylyltransferase
MVYIEKHQEEQGCVFCEALGLPDGPQNLIVYRAKLAFVIINRYPYTSGHLMIVPNAHQPSLEDLDASVRASMMELANQSMTVLRQVYRPQGFNLGINIGEPAGAGITDHIHLHVVPRWIGDTNFMSSLGQTRVIPETLEDTWQRIRQAWQTCQELGERPLDVE